MFKKKLKGIGSLLLEYESHFTPNTFINNLKSNIKSTYRIVQNIYNKTKEKFEKINKIQTFKKKSV